MGKEEKQSFIGADTTVDRSPHKNNKHLVTAKNLTVKEEQIVIKAGTAINYGTHEDGDFFIATKNLIAVVIQYLPGAIQVVIPQLEKEFSQKFYAQNLPISSETFYIHRPN